MQVLFSPNTASPGLLDLKSRLARSASRTGLLLFRLSLLRLTLRAMRSPLPVSRSDPALRESARRLHFVLRPQTAWHKQYAKEMRNPPIHWGPKLTDVWSILMHVRLLPFGESWANWLTPRLPH